MLVLSRDCDTAVKIGNGIRIKVLSIRRQRVKLGVEAPKDVRVWREEVPVKNQELDTHPIRLDTTLDGTDLRPGSDLPILMVEANHAHAILAKKILRGHGYNNVTIVSSGSKALEAMLEAGLPRLVLLDYRLPDMFGDEFVQQVRSHPQLRTVPMVVISADQQDSVVSCCLEAGANAFVAKQIDFTSFQQVLTKTVDFWLDICRVPQSSKNNQDRTTPMACQI